MATSDESGREPSFKVQDRRRFSATGETREEGAEAPASAAAAAVEPNTGTSRARPAAPIPEVTFASYLVGLTTQALVHLGDISDPTDDAVHVDLDGARQIIDIMAILDKKTQGNLDAAERSLLESALYDLRMRYVERTRSR